MVCYGLMLQLHREGHIELPPARNVQNKRYGKETLSRRREL